MRAAASRGLDAAWLRDNCQCSSCRDPASGQRLITITDIAADVSIDRAIQEPDGLHVTFGPDGHETVFSATWLAGYATAAVDARSEDAKRLWSARDFPAGPPVTAWASYADSDAVRLGCLRDLLAAGFLLLTGVPAEPGALARVVASFGYIRETSDGRLFDLRAEPAGPHTGDPFRDPVPTVRALHCLAAAGEGGQTGLLDGFRAAAQLRAEDPAAFERLSRTAVTFGYAGATSRLRASKPMIGLNTAGLIGEIRYDSRAMEPMRPRFGASAARAAEEMRDFYLAYRAFAAIVLRRSLTLRFALSPGDCLVLDNTRMLHSRAGLGGPAHLQGCYADIDGVESTVAMLHRSAARNGSRRPAAALAPATPEARTSGWEVAGPGRDQAAPAAGWPVLPAVAAAEPPDRPAT